MHSLYQQSLFRVNVNSSGETQLGALFSSPILDPLRDEHLDPESVCFKIHKTFTPPGVGLDGLGAWE